MSEEVTEENYITVDPKGKWLRVSLEHIMDTKIQAYEPNGTPNGFGGVKFNKTNEEIREIAEELLGDIVDWSTYDYFSIDLRSHSAPIWDDDHVRNKTFAYLYWWDFQDGKVTDKEISCILEFASLNSDSTIRTFYDKAYIRYVSVVNPFGNKKDLSKYIERVPNYEAFNEYYTDWIKAETGLEPYNLSSEQYFKGRISVYNGKICYCVVLQIYDPNVEYSGESISVILPLE